MRSWRSISLPAACLAGLLFHDPAVAQVQPCEPCLDLAPRGAADGQVTVGDVVLLQRLVVGIDLASLEERRRGDVAPSLPDAAAAALGENPVPVLVVGDGALTVGDVVLALRVVTGATRLRLLPEPELSFVTPQRSCLRSFLTLYGHGLIVGHDLPSVFVAGQQALVVDLRRGEEHGELLDRITVQDGSDADSMVWTEAPVDVLVRTGRGETWLGEALTLAPACDRAPQVLRLEPQHAASGETVRLAGLDLACVTEVDFVGRQTPGLVLPATILAVHGDNALDVRAPTLPLPTAETFDVIARNDCGEGANPPVFDFPDPPLNAPDARWIAPAEGPASGGFSVSLGGTDLDQVDAITVGATALGPADFVVQANGDILIPQVPPSPLGPFLTLPVNVTVSAGGLADRSPVVLSYLGEPAPECATFAPSSGSIAGGTTVVITAALGTSLDYIDGVSFGGVPANALVHPNSSQVAVTTPPFPIRVEVEVAIEHEGVTVSTCPLPFTYE